jgi:hypothetical protein
MLYQGSVYIEVLIDPSHGFEVRGAIELATYIPSNNGIDSIYCFDLFSMGSMWSVSACKTIVWAFQADDRIIQFMILFVWLCLEDNQSTFGETETSLFVYLD